MSEIRLPTTGDPTAAAMARWYANVPRELAADLLPRAERDYMAAYYREAGLLRWWRQPFFRRHFIDSFAAAAAYLLAAPAAGPILDLGCGTGTQSLYLALAGAQVVGVDLDATALAIFRRRQAHYEKLAGRPLDIRLVQGDVFALDLAAWGPVRGVYSMFAFNMMQPSDRLLDDLAGAMAPGGRFVVIDGNNRSLLARLWPGRRRPTWSPTEFARQLEARNLRVDAHAGGVALPPQAWRLLPYGALRALDVGLCRNWLLPVSHQVAAERL